MHLFLLNFLPIVLVVAILLFVVVIGQRRKVDLETRLREASPIRRFFRGPFGLPLILIVIWLVVSLIQHHF
jgi:hypothetical protein